MMNEAVYLERMIPFCNYLKKVLAICGFIWYSNMVEKGGPLSCTRQKSAKCLKSGMNAYIIGGIYPWISSRN